MTQISVGSEAYFIASQNNDSLKVFKPGFKANPLMMSWKEGETTCLIYRDSDKFQRKSKSSKYGYKSQGTNSFWVPKQTQKIEFFSVNGEKLRTEIIKQ